MFTLTHLLVIFLTLFIESKHKNTYCVEEKVLSDVVLSTLIWFHDLC